MKTTNICQKIVMNPAIRLLILCLLLYGMTGCNYYKVITKTPVKPEDLRWEVFNKKYLVLRSGESAWHIAQPVISGEDISGTIEELPRDLYPFLNYNLDHASRYRKEDSYPVLQMVQIFMKESLLTSFHPGDAIRLSPSAIGLVAIYEKDQARTTTSYVVPIVVAPVMVVGVIGIIAALTKSSCPLVYVKNENGYAFAGEIFGGAVDATQERHDYLPLPGFKPDRKGYRLVISNGLPEMQYINLAELWVVRHPENCQVLPDWHGTIRTVTRPMLPLQALSSARTDLRPLVGIKDKQCYLFDESPSATGDTNAFNSVTLSFPVTQQAGTAKLVIRAGNSFWGDYTYGEFTKLFGHDYNAWVRKQGKAQAERNARWKLDQKFALMAYLETSTGWQFIDYFDLIGPMGARDLVMPVGLAGALVSKDSLKNNVIRIRLESGYKFWDLDYAAIDYSPDPAYQVDHISPSEATTESGLDVARNLSRDDTAYYVQLTTGEQGFVLYKAPNPASLLTTSVILHTKGYYEHVRNYTNAPDYPAVESFLFPGRFSRFSWQNYTEFVRKEAAFVSDPNLP